jgi:hypothetical protein
MKTEAWLCAALLALAAALPASAGEDDASARILVLLHLPPQHFRADADYAGGYGDPAGRSARRHVATQIAHEHGLALLSGWPMPLLGVDCYVMALPPERTQEAVVQALTHDARVAWTQPMNSFHAQGRATHDDPLYSAQPAAAGWHLADLHQLATGRQVNVAIIDSGVDAHHPDLQDRIVWNENFVDPPGGAPSEAHGTGVAGIIGARADNRLGIAGIAPQARLMMLRACWQQADEDTRCNSLTLAQALQFAVLHQAQVINLSLTGPPDRLLDKLLDAALRRGITVVSAADRTLPDGGFPASHAGVVAVVDDGPGVAPPQALKAPGRDVPTTLPGARWGLVSGASYAAAHVTGLVALLRELQPTSAAPAFVHAAAGGIDACATLMRLRGPCACACGSATLTLSP